MKIKEGSRWAGSGYRQMFIVLAEVELDDGIWIHYRDESGNPPREYSCYKDSFLSQFTPLPE
jgi:hypothetical protein